MLTVSLDAETYIGEKREYTQIIPETKLIALTESNYIPLTQAQISLCAKIGYMYYCEYAHFLKKRTEHTCMSASFNITSLVIIYKIMDVISRLKNKGLYAEHTDEKPSKEKVGQEDRIEEVLDIATNPSNFKSVFNMNKAISMKCYKIRGP